LCDIPHVLDTTLRVWVHQISCASCSEILSKQTDRIRVVSREIVKFILLSTRDVPMTFSKVLDYIIRICGLAALLLGLLFWSGRFYEFVNVHMTLGVVVVISLWVLALLSFRKRSASTGLIAAATAWGLVTLLLGMGQTHILVGDYHALVQIAHLLMGLGAIGFGAVLSKSLKRSG
jgi:hypothetical protein